MQPSIKTIADRCLTAEQYNIINADGDLKINAVAGSGKTTTVIEYAASRPVGSKILYLAFNRSVKLDAERKFAALNINNVAIETAHSLAFRHIMRNRTYKVKTNGYKIHEIVDILQLIGNKEKHTEHIIANHINKFITYFCNSDKPKVQDLNYLDTIGDAKAANFVQAFYQQIEEGTRQFLAKMNNAEIEITHDFYLKKFQLSKPTLHYDHILFDEGQDASAAMLDIFLRQKATKIIVGDTHQQIYSWRYAVNSLAKTNFHTLHLSTSFRFSQDIANLAMAILKWKKNLTEVDHQPITGNGTNLKQESRATIARSNLGLLFNAIEYITDNRNVKHIYFEGNIHSYTYADDGTSLYDVLNLFNGNHEAIRDKLIRSMNNVEELDEYIEKTEDVQLAMMVELVREYGNEVSSIIKQIKDLHVGDSDRHKAEMIFSTVHKAKGMEYDVVHLASDFITEEKILRLTADKKDDETQSCDYSKLNEEINLLYVAITRTKNKLYIPETLLPGAFPSSPYIHVVKGKKDSEQLIPGFRNPIMLGQLTISKQPKEKAYSLEQKRETHKEAYKPWTNELDMELIQLFDGGASIGNLADYFGRTKGAIISRLKKLNHYDE